MGGMNHARKHKVKDLTGYRIAPERLTIVEDPLHYLYDASSPKEAPPDIIQSIDEHGVLQPIRVVMDGDRFLVAVGRTRVRAAIEVNKLRAKRGDEPILVPYLLDDGSDLQRAERIDIENYHRRDHAPVEIADKVCALKARGASPERIAHLLQIPESSIKKYAAIAQVAPEVREAIACGERPWSIAYDLQNLSRAEQIAKIAEIPAGATVREVKARVKATPGETVKLLKPMTPGKVTALRERLVANDFTELAALLAFIQGEEDALEGYPEIAEVAIEPVEPEPERDPEAPYGRKKDGTPKAKPGKKA